ncbi:hypothetical protein BH24ACT3_BH24ACT3_18090 [soil metagenome]
MARPHHDDDPPIGGTTPPFPAVTGAELIAGGVGPGLTLVVADDPLATGEELAERLGARLVADPAAAADALSAHLEARAAPVGPVPSADDQDRLRRLAVDLTRAERLLAATATEVGSRLTQRLSVSTDLALHPSTLEGAAHAVLVEERTVAAAQAAVDELGGRPETAPGLFPDEPHDDGTVAGHEAEEREAERRAQGRRQGFVVLAVAVVAAIAALLITGSPAVAAGVLAAGGVGVILTRQRTDAVIADWRDRRAAQASLANAASTSDWDWRSVRTGSPQAELDEWDEREGGRHDDLEEAQRRLEAALRSWVNLVGPHADPHDIDAVLRVHDPQFELADGLVTATAAHRSVATLHRRSRARWRVAWAVLGHGEEQAPAASEVDDALSRWAGDHTSTAGEPVLILIDPGPEPRDAELWRRLDGLSSAARVVVVRTPSSEGTS